MFNFFVSRYLLIFNFTIILDNFKKAWYTRVEIESTSENKNFQFPPNKRKKSSALDNVSDSSDEGDLKIFNFYCY